MTARAEQTTDWPELTRRASYSIALLAVSRGISVRQLEREFLELVSQVPEV